MKCLLNDVAMKMVALLNFADDYPGDSSDFTDVMKIIADCVDLWGCGDVVEMIRQTTKVMELAEPLIEDDTALTLMGDAMEICEDYLDAWA